MKILFQGDSITDVGRNTNNGSQFSMGQGYALLTAARLSVDYPGKFVFENRGVSGNRIVDVYARIKADIWNPEPDVLSILIGVNDVWHELGGHNGVDARRFYNVYRMLVQDCLLRNPNLKIIMMEPFVLKEYKTTENWDYFSSEVPLRADAVRRIAREFGQPFLPLQELLDKACDVQPVSYWTPDGVHPSPAGHQLISDAWIRLFKESGFTD